MPMDYILALDQGTTSSRAIVFDRAGAIVSLAQQEFSQYFPQPGWVEHDAEEIWRSQLAVMRQALRDARLSARDIAAIGITNQRETVVLWDRRSGEPVGRAIVWQDRRTADLCAELRANGSEELFTSRTGLLLDPYFSGTKLAWMMEHVPGLRRRAEAGELAFGTVDAWLIWKLSNGAVHVTDASNASRTLLYNIHSGRWDEELLSLLDIPLQLLPTVVDSSAVVAHTADTILGARVPVAGIAGDQQAALFGQACHRPAMVKNTYGTGCFMLMHTGDMAVRSRHRLLTTVAWQRNGAREYALEGSVFIAGAVVQWLRDGLGIIETSAEVERLASSVNDNGGVYFVPAFTGLGAPHWDPGARGVIVGLTRGSGAGHIARAAVESMAYQTTDVIDAMRADCAMPLAELRVDGGAARNDALMQFQADLLGVPVVRPKITETTALGAAYLAGLAVGYWQNTEEIARQWQVDRRFDPAMARDQVQELLSGWRRAVAAARTQQT
jgi:glycerol kinase